MHRFENVDRSDKSWKNGYNYHHSSKGAWEGRGEPEMSAATDKCVRPWTHIKSGWPCQLHPAWHLLKAEW